MSFRDYYILRWTTLTEDDIRAQVEPSARAAGAALRQEAWFDHQNLRAQRVECFATLLEAGSYVYRYRARALRAGSYIAPPAEVKEIYNPTFHSSTATQRIVISPSQLVPSA